MILHLKESLKSYITALILRKFVFIPLCGGHLEFGGQCKVKSKNVHRNWILNLKKQEKGISHDSSPTSIKVMFNLPPHLPRPLDEIQDGHHSRKTYHLTTLQWFCKTRDLLTRSKWDNIWSKICEQDHWIRCWFFCKITKCECITTFFFFLQHTWPVIIFSVALFRFD